MLCRIQTVALAVPLALGLAVGLPVLCVAAEKEVALAAAGDLHEVELASVQDIRIESGWPASQPILLFGSDAMAQVVVSRGEAEGAIEDVTSQVEFLITPPNVAEIDHAGRIRPLAEGSATLTARLNEQAPASGSSASVSIQVGGFAAERPVNFANQVVPIFTRHECNSGGCHGKAAGQNGFRLSLLGFEPVEDYEFLVKEGRGRRLFPAAPERSLLLLKASGSVPHGGGARLAHDSYEYSVVRRWIAQGMPYGSPSDPHIERLAVNPERRTMHRGARQQVVVAAHYSDGSIEDVTRLAQYEPNDTEMADVGNGGLVTIHNSSGDVAVMVRYQGQVALFRATIPLGAKVDSLPPVRSFIDELVFAKLESLGVPPSPLCDDATFIRRAALDIAGRLPTADETRAFLASHDGDKRDRLVDRLVDSDGYAEFFAGKWNAILRNKREEEGDIQGTFAFRDWICESLYQNKPYDQFVRDIVTASGDMHDNPPVAWYRSVSDTEQRVEDTAQLFLGQRIQCARCHHHPFEKWSQRDYYSLAAFFSRVGKKDGRSDDEDRIYHRRGAALASHPKTGERLSPAGLDAPAVALASEDDPRHALVDWMAERDNPYFAPALVNRYWKHFFAHGLVDPEDDLRVTNPPSNPALLTALAHSFVDSGFDLKQLVRTICKSNTYQLSSTPTEQNAADKRNFARYYPKRLPAEVLYDAVDVTLGATSDFAGLPGGTHAIALPDNAVASYFLTVFGRPDNASACECERSVDASLAQSLHLLNSVEIQTKLGHEAGRAALLAGDPSSTDEAKIRDLYLTALAREPVERELATATAHVAGKSDKKTAFEDILWALVNTKEFLFNH